MASAGPGQPSESHSPSAIDDDTVERLVLECLTRLEREGAPALADICALHPQHAAPLRARVEALRSIGLVPAELPAAAEIPNRLGDFRLIRRLGGGGMGVVYLAEQSSLGREVALKVIRPEFLYYGDARARFQREIEATAKLQHPGIVPIYAVGEERAVPYFAMELVRGCTLAEILKSLSGREPAKLSGRDFETAMRQCANLALDSSEARAESHAGFSGSWPDACLHIVRQVAQALEHANRMFLHRDIKPSNIMVTLDGRALLLDFGLARHREATTLTMAGAQLGSLPYMSPEQVRGGDQTLDARTDVYSLGVTLYELLALVSPYASSTTTTTEKRILDGEPVPLRRRNAAVSWETETVCLKAMDRDRNRRYASAGDFAMDLENALARRPIAAKRASTALRMRRWAERHPVAAVTLALGFLLVVVGPSIVALMARRAQNRSEALRLSAQSTIVRAENPGLGLLLAIEGAARNRDLAADNALFAALNDCREMATLIGHSAQLLHAAFSPDPANERVATASVDHTARIWDAATGRTLAVLAGHTAIVRCVAFSPDGRLVATSSDDHTARVWDAASGAPLRVLVGHRDCIHSVHFSPDGAQLITASQDATARIWQVATGAEALPPLEHSKAVYMATFSPPDGRRALTASEDRTAVVWDSGTGARIHTLRGSQETYGAIRCAQFSRDGAWVVTASCNNVAQLWNAATGAERETFVGHEREVVYAALSPDARWVVTAAYDNTARICGVGTQRSLPLIGHTDCLLSASFSPDSQRVATASMDGTARIWDVPTGKEICALRGHAHLVASASFSSDGHRLLTASADGTARIWQLAPGAQALELAGHRDRVTFISYSPDGQRLATASADRTVCVWSPQSGRLLNRLEGHTGEISTAEFSLNGKWLITASNDKTARIWDVEAGTELFRLGGHALFVRHALLSPDNTYALTASGGTLALWSTKTGERLRNLCEFDDLDIVRLKIRGDGRRILAVSHFVGLWSAADGELLMQRGDRHSLALQDFYCDAHFTMDDDAVLTSSRDGSVRIWDPDFQAELVAPAQLANPAEMLVLCPGATRLAAISEIGSITVWSRSPFRRLSTIQMNERTGTTAAFDPTDVRRMLTLAGGVARVWSITEERAVELVTIRRPEARVTCATFGPDGRVATGFSDGKARIWNIYDDPLAAARARRPRALTEEERARFGIGQ